MAERQRAADPEKRHEAENLAREAAEELEHGNTEEGKFLAEEARQLDPNAADAVLKHEDGKKHEDDKPGGQAKSSAKSGHAKSAPSGRGKSGGATKRESGGHEKPGGSAKRTIDHDEIRAWAEARNGRPSVVKRSHDTNEGGGILRIDFEEPEPSLEAVPWDEFLKTFEDRKLAFLHQDRTADGHLSRFFKFVRRDAEDDEEDQG